MKNFLKLSLFSLVIIAVLSVVVFKAADFKEARVYFFNIGQGDGFLLRFPEGFNVLVDGGPDNSLLPKLGQTLPFYDKTIDLMILTHPHADHVLGLVEVLRRYKVKAVLANGILYGTSDYSAWLKEIQNHHIPFYAAAAGQHYVFGNADFEVLFPVKSLLLTEPEDINATSVVAQLHYKNTEALLMGDLETKGEAELVRLFGSELQSELLKVGHHGRDTRSAPDFLDLVKPGYAIIQVGRDNHLGLPSFRVIARLTRLKTRIFRNDFSGDIVFFFKNGHWQPDQ